MQKPGKSEEVTTSVRISVEIYLFSTDYRRRLCNYTDLSNASDIFLFVQVQDFELAMEVGDVIFNEQQVPRRWKFFNVAQVKS